MPTHATSPASSLDQYPRHSNGFSGLRDEAAPPGFVSDDFRKKLSRRLQCSGFRHHDAEDAVQEAALKAIAFLDQQGSPSIRDPEAWFYTVARNAARTSSTRRRERNVETLPEQAASPFDQIDEEEERERLLGAILLAIDELPALKREILLHRYFGGKTIRKTAALLGLTEGMTRGHLRRAQNAVRKHLLENCSIARNRYGM